MENQIPESLREAVKKAIKILREGGIVAYPTDTVYGLGAAIYNERAVKRIFTVKKRSLGEALPILLANIEQINEVARDIPDIGWELAREFMPGGLTLVLLKSPKIPAIVTAGGNTIAVRVPAHPVPVALIGGLGSPIIGTSANLTGQPSPHTAEQVREQLGESVGFIIDGGHVPGKESTIVDVTGAVPAVLREGAISTRNIQRICGEIC